MSIGLVLGRALSSLAILAVLCRPADAQEWNADGALSLVRRAIERRAVAHADSGVRRYRARAEGVVLFLAELGREPTAPRLVKADQVAVEVYWEAPNQSKQLIVAWRERRYLPTDVRYHRDHLGIVTNDFGDRIRLGEGDEVRDVPHPLSVLGSSVYEYAAGDSLVLRGGEGGPPGAAQQAGGEGGEVRVREVLVRPRNPEAPAVVGTLYLDTRTAVLVRFRFGFTRTAYRQPDLEDIAVELENALFDQRYWLPWRQAIEIRRRSAWLAFPIRTTIRGQWTLGDYDFETAFPALVFTAGGRGGEGGPYGGLRAPGPDTGWVEPLDAVALRTAGQGTVVTDLEGLRREVISIAGAAAVVPHPPARLAFGAVSELAHVNRVQGLAVGLGGSFSLGPRVQVMPTVQVGTADSRLLAGIRIRRQDGRTAVALEAVREIRDMSDWPVISGALNSLLAQEGGRDFGDYVLLERARVSGEIAMGRGGGSAVQVGLGIERSKSVSVEAEPASGTYRMNPALGVGSMALGRAVFRSAGRRGNTMLDSELSFEAGVGLEAEAGGGGREYVRFTLDGGLEAPAGPLGSTLIVRFRAGAGSREVPTYRAFPIGGRGTLVGEPFRRYGGRRFAHGRVEWQLPLPVPEIRMGSYASTGRTAILAPFFAVGWAGGVVEDSLWQADAGLRPVLGVASELLFRVLRLELGWAIRSRGVGLVIDASPPWWPVL